MSVKGLSHIHRKGLVHCDLKPENILVFPSLDKEIANYQLKITDFELSKTKEEEADVELWKSKPRGMLSYLSPEAFSGHIDAPIDIWALGCIVIEMLTGLPAWGPDGYAIGFLGLGRLLLLDGFAEKELESGECRRNCRKKAQMQLPEEGADKP
ncbi:mitogen-activated protein kinase 13-like [Arachis ipaensis]|uniref:mitogen-activated protein kinase 13-like n=1 Tax=Arachis ipaensis TaxID=130454 RepID=UPI000A2B8A96|nr:mitogen-activated protein kinase 13-like [Arachis ipaensis]XP_029150147.1 mitogen-activated protein kinase kinase kinase 18-like [Arachis hypogaea]